MALLCSVSTQDDVTTRLRHLCAMPYQGLAPAGSSMNACEVIRRGVPQAPAPQPHEGSGTHSRPQHGV